ncbi:amidohydrolase family protein [Leifsonia sp. RAF41]|uniref:amidohydrolase family protein n=1 Tax=Leifsonia sp. RAF41 TaxID=3233056 RepID=UPI003F9D9AED
MSEAHPEPDIDTYLTVDAVWSGHRLLGETTLRSDGERLHPVEDVPAHARGRHHRLDGTLFPRLTDHHTHLGLTDQHAVFAGGITHAIDLGWIPAVAAGWLTDDLTRPSVAIVGSLITCVGGYPVNAGWGPPGSSSEVGGEREARLVVRANVMLGASRIKVTLNTAAGETVENRVLHGIVAESHAQGVPVTVHVEGEGQTARAVAAGADQLAHAPFTERLDDALIEEAARRGMSWVSTLDIHGWGEPTEQHAIASDNLGRFARAGGRVLYGTDLGNGPLAVGVNERELRGMLRAGVDPDAVLRSIAGLRRPDGRPPTIGPRVAWIPTAPPERDALPHALPGWLATARGLTVAQLTTSDAARADADGSGHATPSGTARTPTSFPATSEDDA